MTESPIRISYRQEVKAARDAVIFMVKQSWLAIPILLYMHNPMWRTFVLFLGAGFLVNLIRWVASIYQMRKASKNLPELMNAETSEEKQSKTAIPYTSIYTLSWDLINQIVLLPCFIIYALVVAEQGSLLILILCGFIVAGSITSLIFAIGRINRIKALFNLGMLIILCSVFGYHYSIGTFTKQSGTPDIVQIREFTGLRFPSDTLVINSISYVFIKYYEFKAVVELDPRQTNTFLENIRQDSAGRATAVFSDTDRIFQNGFGIADHLPHPDWMDTGLVQKFTSINVVYETARVRLMVSLDDPMKPRVYMVGEGYAGMDTRANRHEDESRTSACN